MKSREFSRMVRNVFTRENFINHAIRFLRYYNFDGIDLGYFRSIIVYLFIFYKLSYL